MTFRQSTLLPLFVAIGLCGCSCGLLQAQNDRHRSVIESENRRIETIKQASQSAICIFGPGGSGGGSGVVVTADGFALTNYHVIKSAGRFMKCSMPDGNLYDAVIVGIDPTGDVALVKLFGREDFPVAKLGDSDAVKMGDWCFAVGNPFLLATDFQPSVSWGIVSGTHRYQYPAGTLLEYADCIQTDAAINPGNSGGPLFSSDGLLIGINGRGSFEKRGRVNVGVGYAISINQIKHFMAPLMGGRIVDHATLGATLVTNGQGEIRIADILESSDAFRRGLRYDDQITRFAGQAIRSVNHFKNILGTYPKDWTVPLTFVRDNKETDVTIRLTGVHSTEKLNEIVQGPNPSMRPGKRALDDVPDDDPKKRLAENHRYRRGFANYYFNLQMRDKIWHANQAFGDFRNSAGRKWKITGLLNGRIETQILLASDESGIRIGNDAFVLDPDLELEQQLVPDESGGLLVALHLWRSFLVQGPSEFGEVFYLGKFPILSFDSLNAERAEILVATTETIESRILFSPESGRMIGFEMFPDINVDPCRLFFKGEFRKGTLSFPSNIEWSFGERPIQKFEVLQVELIHGESR